MNEILKTEQEPEREIFFNDLISSEKGRLITFNNLSSCCIFWLSCRETKLLKFGERRSNLGVFWILLSLVS